MWPYQWALSWSSSLKLQPTLSSPTPSVMLLTPFILHYCIYQCTILCMPAKSLQSCLTLCNPVNCSPPGSSVHGDFPGKNTGVGRHAVLQRCVSMNGFSEPRLLHLSIHRKAPNSWACVFPLTNNSTLMFRLPALFRKTSVYSGSPSSPLWSRSLRVFWDAAEGLKS